VVRRLEQCRDGIGQNRLVDHQDWPAEVPEAELQDWLVEVPDLQVELQDWLAEHQDWLAERQQLLEELQKYRVDWLCVRESGSWTFEWQMMMHNRLHCINFRVIY
jgi:hypothetical protein